MEFGGWSRGGGEKDLSYSLPCLELEQYDQPSPSDTKYLLKNIVTVTTPTITMTAHLIDKGRKDTVIIATIY